MTKVKKVKEEGHNIPLFHPYISSKARKKVQEVLDSKFIGQGPKIPEFEDMFGKKFKAEYPVATNSCTGALHMAYRLAGVKEGDEVVGPLLTCSATWHPLLQLGGVPVFCDIKDDFTVDPEDIEDKITKKTKAIVVMHYGGTMCDMDSIMEIADKHDLPVIEDAAQALGAYYNGEKQEGYAGTIGDYGCFSFQAIKYLTTVDGGMLTVKDEETFEKAKRIRWFGIDRDKKIEEGWEQFKDWEKRKMTYDVEEVGYKYHMNDINAAIGMEHLKDFELIENAYENMDRIYREGLKDVEGVEFLNKKEGDTTWLETVLLEDRDKIADKLEEEGIETNVVHIRSDVYSLFKQYVKENQEFPTMDKHEFDYLCLPIHMHLTPKDIEKVCKTIKNAS